MAAFVVDLPGDSFLKLHPHSKTDDPVSKLGFKQVLPAVIPAELLLVDLCELYDSVHVYHHESSVALYFTADNLQYHEIEEADDRSHS